MDKINYSFSLLNQFFFNHNIKYWLEAGTALAAFRDGKVFSWDHDIDIAIWRTEKPEAKRFIDFFEDKGYDVIVQKHFPYIDNIIQLKVREGFHEKLFDVDIYLYTRKAKFAYMRWVQKPEGKYGRIKRRVIFTLRSIINPKTDKGRLVSSIIPNRFSKFVFMKYLRYHIHNSTCIFHRFPEEFFINLKEIDFYGVVVYIPSDTEAFLAYRYGEGWKVPDSQFNQSGKWKKSQARVELKMNILPDPDFYEQNLDLD